MISKYWHDALKFTNDLVILDTDGYRCPFAKIVGPDSVAIPLREEEATILTPRRATINDCHILVASH